MRICANLRCFSSLLLVLALAGCQSAGPDMMKMSFRITGVQASQYLRLRGTNMPPNVPYETDVNGNPLADIFTNAAVQSNLRIPCTGSYTDKDGVTTTIPAASTSGTPLITKGNMIHGCPSHLSTATAPSPIAGQLAVSFDVAAWADLWFYSNPIFVEVQGSTAVAGVQ